MPLPTRFVFPHTNGRPSATVASNWNSEWLRGISGKFSERHGTSRQALGRHRGSSRSRGDRPRPPPQTFLRRLPSISGKDRAAGEGGVGGSEGCGEEAAVRVTRSIMIKRPAGCPSPGNATPPVSPAGSTPPISLFSGGEWNRFRRKSSSDAYDRRAGRIVGIGSRDPTS